MQLPTCGARRAQDMLARTAALEERLMKLGMERNDLEAEYARLPATGKTVQVRGRGCWGGAAGAGLAVEAGWRGRKFLS